MNTSLIKILCLILVCLAMPFVACAQNPYPPAGAEVTGSAICKDFVERYVSAVNAKAKDRIKLLLHRGCVPLLDPDPNSANNWPNLLSSHLSHTIPDQREVSVTTILPGAELPWPDGVIWPVPPTNQVVITFKDAHGKKSGIVVFVAADGDKWYEVISTPRP